MKIRQELELDAPSDRVWRYLIDPERVVMCLPGASIDSWDGSSVCEGSIKLKVGPASMTYQGVAEFIEVDEDGRRMRLEGKGREKGGGGRVSMVMEGSVEPVAGGGSRVKVDVHLKLAGKIVKFGRGMIGVVSERLFQDFGVCLAERLTTASGAESDAPTGHGEHGDRHTPEALGGIRLVLRALWSRLRQLFGAGD